MLPPSSRRGSALLVALIALAVLMILVVGAITFTGTNREAAAAKSRGDRVTACADTAKRMLLARLRTEGASAQTLVLVDEPIPDAVNLDDRSAAMTAHYGEAEGSITRIVAPNPKAFGASLRQVSDVANVIRESQTGGSYYRVVVKCAEGGGLEAETEFVFRHGY